MLFASLAAFAAPEATAVVLVQREARDEGFALELDGWIADDALPHVIEGSVVLLGPDGREPLDVRPGEVWTVEGASGTPWMARLHEEVDPDRLILRGDLAALREIAVLLDARITVQADESALIERPGVLLDVGWLADEEEGRAVEDVELVRGRPTREEAVLRAHLPAARPSQADRERRFADALLARLSRADEASHAAAAALSTPEVTAPPTPSTVPDDEALEAARRRYAGRHLCGETFVVLHPSGAFAGAGYRGTWTPVQDGLIRVSSGDLERAFLVTFHPGTRSCRAVWAPPR
ncbi:MAG: hypothetical protein H6736_25030 [Alphaproteobacteria bacterium]|nr:hypothetical protein [Alphaproteobacteria bacterium]